MESAVSWMVCREVWIWKLTDWWWRGIQKRGNPAKEKIQQKRGNQTRQKRMVLSFLFRSILSRADWMMATWESHNPIPTRIGLISTSSRWARHQINSLQRQSKPFPVWADICPHLAPLVSRTRLKAGAGKYYRGPWRKLRDNFGVCPWCQSYLPTFPTVQEHIMDSLYIYIHIFENHNWSKNKLRIH